MYKCVPCEMYYCLPSCEEAAEAPLILLGPSPPGDSCGPTAHPDQGLLMSGLPDNPLLRGKKLLIGSAAIPGHSSSRSRSTSPAGRGVPEGHLAVSQFFEPGRASQVVAHQAFAANKRPVDVKPTNPRRTSRWRFGAHQQHYTEEEVPLTPMSPIGPSMPEPPPPEDSHSALFGQILSPSHPGLHSSEQPRPNPLLRGAGHPAPPTVTTCRSCAAVLTAHDTCCPECGAESGSNFPGPPVYATVTRCCACSSLLPPGEKFCPDCGASSSSSQSPPPARPPPISRRSSPSSTKANKTRAREAATLRRCPDCSDKRMVADKFCPGFGALTSIIQDNTLFKTFTPPPRSKTPSPVFCPVCPGGPRVYEHFCSDCGSAPMQRSSSLGPQKKKPQTQEFPHPNSLVKAQNKASDLATMRCPLCPGSPAVPAPDKFCSLCGATPVRCPPAPATTLSSRPPGREVATKGPSDRGAMVMVCPNCPGLPQVSSKFCSDCGASPISSRPLPLPPRK
eukprot:gene4678-4868_t